MMLRETQELVQLLRHHPDAKRTAGDGDKARATGLQSVQVSATGDVHILWHWGRVSFAPGEDQRFAAYLLQ